MKHDASSLPRLLIAAFAIVLVSIVMVSFGGRAHAQSLSYTSGQPVIPAYEGWEEAVDGTKYFLFGYMNRNWEEELDVPVGADNGFAPGTADQGQPTHFLPRRNRFVFRVRVPQGFSDKDELVWTLTAKNKTTKAYASLRPDYKVDDVVKASETGALGAGTSSPKVRANKAPVVVVEGEKTRTVKAGERLSIRTTVTDDGVPRAVTESELVAALTARARAASGAATAAAGEGSAGRGAAAAPSAAPAPAGAAPSATPPASPPRINPALFPPTRVTVGKNLGLHLSWFVYRGAGKVHFSPDQIKAWEDTRAGANSPWAPIWFAPPLPADGKLAVDVVFDEPGTYVLRGLADDGALTTGENLTVTVTR
jgi:hypothetical protein